MPLIGCSFDGNGGPLRNKDGSLALCPDCSRPLYSYEAIACLNGKPQECVFADEAAGVMVLMHGDLSRGFWHEAVTGEVEIKATCLNCAKKLEGAQVKVSIETSDRPAIREEVRKMLDDAFKWADAGPCGHY